MKKENCPIVALASQLREAAHTFIIRELKAKGVVGIAPSHGGILQLLFQTKAPVTMQHIAAFIRKDKSTVTALVAKLEKLGYVTRMRSEEDKRSIYVALTPQAWAFEPIFREVSFALKERLLKNIDQTTLQEVCDALENMIENLD